MAGKFGINNNLSAEVSAIFVRIIKNYECLLLEKFRCSIRLVYWPSAMFAHFLRCHVVKHRKDCGDLFHEEFESLSNVVGEICGCKDAARVLTLKFEQESVGRVEPRTTTGFNQSKVKVAS